MAHRKCWPAKWPAAEQLGLWLWASSGICHDAANILANVALCWARNGCETYLLMLDSSFAAARDVLRSDTSIYAIMVFLGTVMTHFVRIHRKCVKTAFCSDILAKYIEKRHKTIKNVKNRESVMSRQAKCGKRIKEH
jgi:hypothetical protein